MSASKLVEIHTAVDKYTTAFLMLTDEIRDGITEAELEAHLIEHLTEMDALEDLDKIQSLMKKLVINLPNVKLENGIYTHLILRHRYEELINELYPPYQDEQETQYEVVSDSQDSNDSNDSKDSKDQLDS